MRILAEDALSEFPTEDITVTTPCGPCPGIKALPADSICAVSIVRSGDCLLEAVREVEPGVKVGKILIQRDEVNWAPIKKTSRHGAFVMPIICASHTIFHLT